MMLVVLTVNGARVSETVEPRTHLADLLRDKLCLTGTHLRCEQGACGACTLLIDGQPARSCITYAVMCQGAGITTIEGLESDPVMTALRRAFADEHGLQCGFCTPGMLVTARDIVTRLPDADERRIRLELSGNLCRCTGYVGIVRAICRVLKERKSGKLAATGAGESRRLGPVGSQHAEGFASAPVVPIPTLVDDETHRIVGDADLGLGGRKPNMEIHQSFVIARPPQEVWRFLADVERVVPCIPGAMLTGSRGERWQGQIAIRLGPIGARFNGEARLIRDDTTRHGMILGVGWDRLSASRANAELEYALTSERSGAVTRVDIKARALLLGPLAQFGRSAIINDLGARLSDMFARRLERRLAGLPDAPDDTGVPIAAGRLLGGVIVARTRNALARLLGGVGRRFKR
ncbi:MAG: 2Fe-2S iron-sulfur cluster-binding protein [Xanthobacteraceae bacterium]